MMIDEMFAEYRNFASVDLNAIVHNGKVAKRLFPKSLILSVLKADAYGHGISGVLPGYETFTDWYAAATFEEAMSIRANSQKPILIFGPVPSGCMIEAAKKDITFTVGSVAYAKVLSQQMTQAGIQCNCHLKIDTGLNRSGIRWREPQKAMEEIRLIRALPNLLFTGTYTHLACGEGTLDWELAHTDLQIQRFRDACEAMEAENLALGIRHCASTGGSLIHPEFQFDMVRLGMLPMGMSYSDKSVEELGLIPALTWISYVAQIETVRAGESVSYGCTFRAEKEMRIGIVTCGYADGYRRAYSNAAHVLVGGRRVPVLGRIAMDHTVIDLTDVSDAAVGMPVVMLGSDGVNSVSAQELSQYGESVSGEVTCAISQRVPRFYIPIEGENDHV